MLKILYTKRVQKVILLLIVAAGIFLRFYRLDAFITFLGDQGRDAIIIKRILTFEHLPAIGAPTSIGQVYLGPFYYYFIAPWLLLFRLNPLGLGAGVAFFSSLYIILNYFIIKELINEKVAFISTIFISFSSILILFSRFSWNPNLMSLFTLLTFYFFIKAIRTRKLFFFALSGALLSFTIQLHYIALLLSLPIALTFVFRLIKSYTSFRVWKEVLFMSVFFIICSVPLIVFDLRHDFLNAKNFISLFTTQNPLAPSAKLTTIVHIFSTATEYVLDAEITSSVSLVLFILIIGMCGSIFFKKKGAIKCIVASFVVLIFGFSFFKGPYYAHYFGILYPFYYLTIAYFISIIATLPFSRIAIVIIMIAFILTQKKSYYFFQEKGPYQIRHAQKVAEQIKKEVKKDKYTVTALPQKYSDSIYRYFLEIWGERPIEKDSLEKANELFVICEGPCKPIGDPQWDIAYFAPNKIVGQWKIDHVTLYKLIR